MRFGLKPDGQRDIDDRQARTDRHLLRAFDPSARQVFVRPPAGGPPELRTH
jgi:hypothetical protein